MKTKLIILWVAVVSVILWAVFAPKQSHLEKLIEERNELEASITWLQLELSWVNQQIEVEAMDIWLPGSKPVVATVEAAYVEPTPTGTMYRHQGKNPLPPVSWNTPQKRFEALVKYFWLDPLDFVAVRNEYKVPEELIACIVWSDTWFTALKSANNLGNVWNNDRWDVIHYNSMQEGLMAIWRVLNNKYLGNYTMIGELSQGGRIAMWLPMCWNGNACYATSEYNWNANVLDCMSFVHWKRINEDHKFR